MECRFKESLRAIVALAFTALHLAEDVLPQESACETQAYVSMLQHRAGFAYKHGSQDFIQNMSVQPAASIPSASRVSHGFTNSSTKSQVRQISGDDRFALPESSLQAFYKGYNVFYGEPLTDSEDDLGFTKFAGKPIFDSNQSYAEVFQEDHMMLQDGGERPMPSTADCTFNVTLTSRYRTRELIEALQFFVSAEGGESGDTSHAWFRASEALKTFEKMNQQNARNVIGILTCSIAELNVNKSQRRHLSAPFLQRVHELPDIYDARRYFDLFDDFGTHVITSATMGAMAGTSAYYNEIAYTYLNSSHVSWRDRFQNMSIALSLERTLARNNTLAALQSQSASFSMAAMAGRIVRGMAPTSTDANSWLKLVASAPVPIRAKLTSVCGSIRAISETKAKLCDMAAAASEYCMRRVMPREGLDPRSCLQDASDIECLWSEDCGVGAVCDRNTCRLASVQLNSSAQELVLDNGTHTANHTSSFYRVLGITGLSASATLNCLVVLPMLIVAIPLAWAWSRLLSLSDLDEVWTAQDENLREVGIDEIGASGVVLLRTPSDRKLAILLSFVGIMLQTMFLYYMSVYCFVNLGGKDVTHDAPPALLFGSIWLNAVVCCGSMITGMKAWSTTAPKGYEHIHLILVGLDSFIMPGVSLIVGSLYLCISSSIASLVMNSTAMAFVCSINHKLALLMHWSLSAHGGRIYQPAKLGIKDAVNSMEYTYISLAFAGVVAMIMVPVGTFLFKI